MLLLLVVEYITTIIRLKTSTEKFCKYIDNIINTRYITSLKILCKITGDRKLHKANTCNSERYTEKLDEILIYMK